LYVNTMEEDQPEEEVNEYENRIQELEEEVELLREEVDYIIDRKGLRELMDNE